MVAAHMYRCIIHVEHLFRRSWTTRKLQQLTWRCHQGRVLMFQYSAAHLERSRRLLIPRQSAFEQHVLRVQKARRSCLPHLAHASVLIGQLLQQSPSVHKGKRNGVSETRKKASWEGGVVITCTWYVQDAKYAAIQTFAAKSAPQMSLRSGDHSASSDSEISSALVPAGIRVSDTISPTGGVKSAIRLPEESGRSTHRVHWSSPSPPSELIGIAVTDEIERAPPVPAGTRVSDASMSPKGGMKSAGRLPEESGRFTPRVQWSSPSPSSELVGLAVTDEINLRPPPVLPNRLSRASPSSLRARSPSPSMYLTDSPMNRSSRSVAESASPPLPAGGRVKALIRRFNGSKLARRLGFGSPKRA